MGFKSIKTNLLGKHFGKWLVLSEADRDKKVTYWLCKCECGRIKKVAAGSLKRGVSKSCGKCSHGMTNSPEYESWASMKARVLNKNHDAYQRYGGRGISICEKWMSFVGFFEDMGKRPEGFTLDRIDNNGNYCKENCKWSSHIEQANNTSWNRIVEYNDNIYTVSELSKLLGIKYTTLRRRILTGGLLDAPTHCGKKQAMR